MPIYEFKCPQCHKIYEKIMSIHDPNPKCENCGGDMNKLISQTSFAFKGNGWYVTDYKNTQAPKTKEKESKAGPSSEKKNSKKTVSKKQDAT